MRTSSQQTESTGNWRWRTSFSLSTFLLLTAVAIILGASNFITARKLNLALKELSTFDENTAIWTFLEIHRKSTLSQFHQLKAKHGNGGFHIPEGQAYRFCIALRRIPWKGLPEEEHASLAVSAGESLLVGHLFQNSFNQWEWSLKVAEAFGDSTTKSSSIDPDDSKWLQSEWLRQEGLAEKQWETGTSGQETFPPREPISLLRRRAHVWTWDQKR